MQARGGEGRSNSSSPMLLQEEARYLSSALGIDLNSKAALPRARSSLANCAALLS